MAEPRTAAEAASEIESFRREIETAVRASRVRVRSFDGVEVVRIVVPEGLHAELWRCGALVLPGTVALEWVTG